ncbi:DUF6958 family protein [Olivibacter sitiensis]|uniref:DUF6958 family protein n=1 Tax=Olivibacter sitiensis TaxID=376470 RepID=UPI00040225F4|nr:hypothetical protein [Olivibacter sitiensis]
MEKLQMKHPDPTKKTVAMDKDKYDTLKNALVSIMKSQKEMTFKEMLKGVTDELARQKVTFQGNVQWHLAWVQMDMEAGDELSKNNKVSPQTFSLAK